MKTYLCVDCSLEKEGRLTSLGYTCNECITIRRPRDLTVPYPKTNSKLTDAFFVRHPKGEQWVVILGNLTDTDKYEHRRMVMSKKELVSIIKSVEDKTYNPAITFIGIDTRQEFFFPILTIRSNERVLI